MFEPDLSTILLGYPSLSVDYPIQNSFSKKANNSISFQIRFSTDLSYISLGYPGLSVDYTVKPKNLFLKFLLTLFY
jgi:hypothetical protein